MTAFGLKNAKTGKVRETVFFLLCLSLLFVQILTFAVTTDVYYFSFKTKVFISLTDALVFLLPFFLLPCRFRWAVSLPMVLLPLYLAANTLYMRNFQDLIPFKSIFAASSYNVFVFRSALSSFEAADAVYVGALVVFVAAFAVMRPWRVQDGYGLRSRAVLFGVCAMLFVGEMLFMHKAFREYNQDGIPGSLRSRIMMLAEGISPVKKVRLCFMGLPLYSVSEVCRSLKPDLRLTREDQSAIEGLLERQSSPPPMLCKVADNSRKNLIVVVVESLNSEVLSLKTPKGEPLFPFLDSLSKDSAALTFTRMVAQVGEGRSSDGNLMYMTGMLPIKSEPVASGYAERAFPSLPRALGRSSVEVIAENADVWNHAQTNVSFGYDQLVADASAGRKPGERADSACFAQALKTMRMLARPFLATVFTIDMHDPYDDTETHGHMDGMQPEASRGEMVYLSRVAVFEEALAGFIDGLKRYGMYDDSVIVVVSDHDARQSCLDGRLLDDRHLFLCILNSGIDRSGMRFDAAAAEIAQIDLYPTLLDVMGKGNYGWRGFGRSVLRDPRIFGSGHGGEKHDRVLEDPYPSEEAWRVSELMVRSGCLPAL